MSPNAIYSKSGKGVQEASGKTSQLPRAERAVLSAFDGKMTVAEVADKVGKPFDAKFEELVGKLDKDGFVRQVSAGAPVAGTPKQPAPAPKPAAPGGKAPGEDLDFTIAMPAPKAAPPKPAAPPPAPPVAPQMAQSNAAAFAKAREEAEEKAAKERDRIKAETEAKLRAETEAKMRSEAELKAKEAEQKAKADAEARVKAEAEAKIKAARDAAVRAAAEAKAKAEAEANAKLEAERARAREAEEKARRIAEEAKRQAEEAKRKAEEEARKAREEAERIRKEAEEAKRQAEEAKRKAEEEARRIREEAERRAKEEEQRRAKEEAERKAREAREKQEREAREKQEREAREQQEREEEEREAREKAERKAREKAEREQREREDEEREEQERQAKKARDRAAREEADREKAPAAKPAGKKDDFGDSLLADLDSFSQREDDDRKAKEEATRKEKEEKQRRAKEAEEEAKRRAEREEKEEAERKEKERRRKEEEARAREEEERRQREEQEREREKQEAERRRKARAKDDARPAAGGDDIPVSDDDLDMDEVKKDEALLSKESRRAAREREEREKQAKKDAKKDAKREAKEEKEEKKERARREEPVATPQFRRPRKWGKALSMTLFFGLIIGVGVLHVMPISTAEYEKAASEATGLPVRISSARLSLYSGVMLKLDGVSIGDTRVAAVRAFPEIGSLFNEKKAFSRIELEGVTVPQQSLGGLFAAKVRSDNFSVGRINAKQVKVSGPLPLPTLEVDLALGSDGVVTSTSLRGADGLSGKLTPKGASEMEFDVVAHSFTVPVVPDMTLSGFAMKGTATRDGMRIESWGGSQLDGAVSGSANVRWASGSWTMDGVMTVRGINAAVFAPALLSEGKAEGTGRFSFNDADPMAFLGRGRIEGTFSVHKGVLGSFDLSRAITTGGRQVGGRTPFTGMSGQGVFDKGTVALRNVSFGAGALNAGASADISAEGTLSGRIVADVRTPSQTLRATLNLGGTVRDPQVRN